MNDAVDTTPLMEAEIFIINEVAKFLTAADIPHTITMSGDGQS